MSGEIPQQDKSTLESKLKIEALESAVSEIKSVASVSHDLAMRQDEKLNGVIEWQRRQNGAVDKLTEMVTKNFAELKREMQRNNNDHKKEIERFCHENDERFESFQITSMKQQATDRDKFQRWMIGIMGTIIAGLLIAIVSTRFGI